MSLPVMKQAFDAIVNVLAGGDFDNPLCDLKQAALALHQAIAKADKQEPWVKTYCGGKPNYTEPVQDEGWYGQWQWQCGYERGWDKAMEHVEAKLKEKNNG